MWVYPPTNIAVLMRKMRINQVSSHFSSFFVVDMGPRCSAPVQSQAESLKRHLAPQLGVSRFRLRLLREGSSECLADQEALELPMTLQLVILGFAPNEVQGGMKDVPCGLQVLMGECATAINGKHGVTVRSGISFVTVCICLWHVFGKISKISHVLEMFHGLVMWKRYFFNNPLVR